MPNGVSAASQIVRKRHGWPLKPYLFESETYSIHSNEIKIVDMFLRFKFSFENMIGFPSGYSASSLHDRPLGARLPIFWNIILDAHFRRLIGSQQKEKNYTLRKNISKKCHTLSSGRVKSGVVAGLL